MPPVGRGFGSCYDEAAEIEMESESYSESVAGSTAGSVSESEANSGSGSESLSEINSSMDDDNDNDVENEINVNVTVNSGVSSENNGNDDEEKITICHDGQTIEVNQSAVQAHLDHGDTLGPCEDLKTEARADPEKTTEKSETAESK